MTLESAASALAPPSILLMGYNDSGWLGEGWHDLERDGRSEVSYRATRRVGELRVGRPEGALRLFLLYAGSPSLLGKTLSGRVEIEGGARHARASHPLRLETDVWRVLPLALPEEGAGSLTLRIHADDLIVPDRTLRNGDARALGFYVSAVWCR
jgi:hypothetical protein